MCYLCSRSRPPNFFLPCDEDGTTSGTSLLSVRLKCWSSSIIIFLNVLSHFQVSNVRLYISRFFCHFLDPSNVFKLNIKRIYLKFFISVILMELNTKFSNYISYFFPFSIIIYIFLFHTFSKNINDNVA